SDHLFNVKIHARQLGGEYAIPIERTAEALSALARLVQRGKCPLHLPVDVRFSGAEDAWLSPAHGRDRCYIGVQLYRPYGLNLEFERTLRAADELLAEFDGRPHWGKIHYRTAAFFAASYRRFNDFTRVRAELDPAGIFLNAHLRGLFGPVEGS